MLLDPLYRGGSVVVGAVDDGGGVAASGDGVIASGLAEPFGDFVLLLLLLLDWFFTPLEVDVFALLFEFVWSLVLVSGFIASRLDVVGAVGSVWLPAVGDVVVESPALGVVESGGVVVFGFCVDGDVDGYVLPLGEEEPVGEVCCAITAAVNIVAQTKDARRADFKEIHFMSCLAIGEDSPVLRMAFPRYWLPRKSLLIAMRSNPNRMR